jgi:hypothetical protein
MKAVTGQREEMILVPRVPTKNMLDEAYYPALAEDAGAVWEAMIEEYERQTSLGKSGSESR